MRLVSALLFASSAALALGAAAQTRIYCCDDANGRKVCGDYKPAACEGRAYEERNNRGEVSNRFEAPLTEEQQARRDAEAAKKEEEKKKAAEERRRTIALMQTYSSEKDINSARDRVLSEVGNNLKQAQQRLEDANKKKQKLDSEKEFYKGKPLPEQLKSQIRDNDKEIKAQKASVEAKIKEMEEVRARFAEERKRYLELTGKKSAEGAPSAPAAAAPAAPAAPAAESKPAAAPAPQPAPAAAKPAAAKK